MPYLIGLWRHLVNFKRASRWFIGNHLMCSKHLNLVQRRFWRLGFYKIREGEGHLRSTTQSKCKVDSYHNILYIHTYYLNIAYEML
jgi:hypothetical protein